MIDDDLRGLESRTIDHALDQLEVHVWHGVALRSRQRKETRMITSLQGVFVVLSLVGTIAVGISAARPVNANRSALMPGFELMPSHLLLHRQS